MEGLTGREAADAVKVGSTGNRVIERISMSENVLGLRGIANAM
jgi:hypothetical protein